MTAASTSPPTNPPATAAPGPSAKASAAPIPGPPPHRLLAAQTLAAGEKLLVEERATALFFFPLPIAFLILFAALGSLSYTASTVWGNAFAAGFALFAFYVFLVLILATLIWLTIRFFRWRSRVYAVTSRRVIVQMGNLGHSFEEIPLLQIRGVNITQSPWQRLMGYGTIRISSEGSGHVGNEDWKGIPKPMAFQQKIQAAIDVLQSGASTVAFTTTNPTDPAQVSQTAGR